MSNITGSITAKIGADINDYKKAMSEVVNSTTSAMSKVTSTMSNSTNSIVSKVGSIMSKLSTTIPSKLGGLGTSLVAPFNKASGQIQRIVSSIGEKIPSPIQKGFSKVAAGVYNAFGKVGSTLEGTSGKISSFVSNFRSGMSQSEKSADSFSNKLTKISLAVVAMYAANKVISGISKGISNLVSDLNVGSATWKTFNANMANIGMGKKEIASVKTELQDFATETIYSASEMATTYSQLAAVGIKNTNKLVKGFGGLAAAAADPSQAMTTLSQQATQMAAKPKVEWADFKLMLEQTPAGIAAVAKTMGMSTAEMVTNVQDGTIATQDFFDAVTATGTNDVFSKMATEYKTMGQAMDGFQETITNKLQPSFDKLSQVGIDAISKITDKLDGFNMDKITKAIANGVNKTIPIFENMFKVISKIFNFLSSHKDVLKSFAVGVLSAAAAFKVLRTAANISATISAVSTALSGSTKALSVLAKTSKIAAAAQWVFNAAMNANPVVLLTTAIITLVAGLVYFFTQTKTGQKIVENTWNSIKSVVASAAIAIKTVWTNMTAAFSGIWDTVKSGTIKAWGTITSTLSTVWQTIQSTTLDVFTSIGHTINTVWQSIVNAAIISWNFILTNIQMAVTAITTFVTTYFSGMITGLQTIWTGMTTIASGAWELLKNVILGPVLLLSNLVTGNFTKLGSDASAIWDNIKSAASSIWGGIRTVISGIAQTILGYITGVWNTLKQVSTSVWNSMKTTATSIWQGLKNFIASTVQTIKSTVTNIFQSTVNISNNLWIGLKNSVLNIINGMKSGIVNGFNLAKSSTINIFNNIRSGISSAMSAASTLVSSSIERIKSFFKSLGNINLYSIGMNIIQGLINGVSGKLGELWNTISGIASGISSKISNILGIHSPSRVMDRIGGYTGQGLINGMQSMQKGVEKQAGAFGEVIRGQQYQAEAVMVADTTFTNRNISTFAHEMDDDIENSTLKQEDIYVHNEIVGDKIYTTVKRKEARGKNKDKYFT